MKYKTLFNLATQKVHYFQGPLPIAYILLIIGTGVIISLFLEDKQHKEIFNGNIEVVKKLLIGCACIAMSLIFLLLFLGSQFSGVFKARQIIQKGTYTIVEGKPQNYHPMTKEGHDEERFDIAGVHFEYSDFVLKFGYSNGAYLGGVIKPENYYRITYFEEPYNNAIIKIEIKE